MIAALAATAACATDVMVEDGANPVVVTELDAPTRPRPTRPACRSTC
jgi:hypothetical protein